MDPKCPDCGEPLDGKFHTSVCQDRSTAPLPSDPGDHPSCPGTSVAPVTLQVDGREIALVTAARLTQESAPLAREELPPALAAKIATLAAVTPILLDVFSVVDDVFTESDALSPEKRQVGLSRIYRAYKKAKAQLDPDGTA